MKLPRKYKKIKTIEEALLLPVDAIDDVSERLSESKLLDKRTKNTLGYVNKFSKKIKKLSPEVRDEVSGELIEENLFED